MTGRLCARRSDDELTERFREWRQRRNPDRYPQLQLPLKGRSEENLLFVHSSGGLQRSTGCNPAWSRYDTGGFRG